VLADVSNTYDGRQQYWLRPQDDAALRFRATAAKSLAVSPFMESQVDYEFVLTTPGPTLVAHMNVVRRPFTRSGRDRLFDATLTLERQPWTAAAMRAALVRFPWMTAKVMAAIHWEALRLRLKGVPVIAFPGGRQ
jgi:DUF1365 family protein